jgi:hypothetical protein
MYLLELLGATRGPGFVIVSIVLVSSLLAQEHGEEDELGQHVATLKRQVEDTSLPIGKRESLVLGMTGTLDRAAQAASNVAQKAARWNQAIELLDTFNSQNPGHPRAREFQLQAGVYRWAQGQSWHEAGELDPTNSQSLEQAVAALDDSVTRLRSVATGEAGDALADNLRFRLARSLADRADHDKADSAIRRDRESEALELVKQPVDEPGLKGFCLLLKADLLRRTNRPDEAALELESAVKAEPPPPEREILEVRVPIMIAQKKFADAIAVLKASHLEEPAKELGLIRVLIAKTASLSPGPDRFSDEQELFRQIKTLRDLKMPESRLALAELAEIGLDPEPGLEPEAWDILAEGLELRGDAERAGALEQRAALRAEELGRPEAAAGFRLRGGGFLFQAGKYVEADALLTRVVGDPRAGNVRAKANMLRGLARGRALAAGLPGTSPAAYIQALQEQIRDFPKDPLTDEARWLLGTLARATGDKVKAENLWSSITPASSRWLDSRLAIAELMRAHLESELRTAERAALVKINQKAQASLADSLKQARNETDQIELALADARLALVPFVGAPARALALAERAGKMNINSNQRFRANLYRMIAQAQLGHYVEAERLAQTYASWAEPGANAAFLDAVRLLDQSAATSEIDLPQRRFGMVLRLLVQPVIQDADDEKWSADERAELKLRLVRALLFLGDERGARGALRGWTGPPGSSGDELLRDLADAYNRLEAYEMAIDVERLRARTLPAGSPSWFDARYGLALAYFHTGQEKEAAQLIDATSILHPELGGGSLQKKFIKLRQRLGSRP